MATIVSVTGVSANALEGSLTGGWGSDVYGRDGWNEPSSNAGFITGEIDGSAEVTGISANALLAPFKGGWGRLGWGNDVFGTADEIGKIVFGITVLPNGVSSEVVLSEESITGEGIVTPTGLASSAVLNSVITITTNTVSVTGVGTDGVIGDTDQHLDMSVFPTAVTANGETPEATDTEIDGSTETSGVSADVVLSDETVIFDSVAEVTGVSSDGLTGVFTGGWGRLGWGDDPWGQLVSAGKVEISNLAEPAGVSATGSVGSVSLEIPAEVSVTGVASSVDSGSPTVVVDAEVFIVESGGWGSGDWSFGIWGGAGDSLAIDSSVGDIDNTASGSVVVTGVGAVAPLGDVEISPETFIDVTGVQSDVAQGLIPFDEIVFINNSVGDTGWGRGTWSEGSWGEPIGQPLVAADVGLGETEQHFDVQVSVTGLSASVSEGSVQVDDATAETTGVSATLDAGSLDATGDAVVPIQEGAGWGRDAWGDGTWGQPTGDPTPAISTEVGSVTASIPGSATLTGVESVGFIGEIRTAFPGEIFVTGVETVIENGTIKLYIQVDDSQTPNYQEVDSSQTPAYTPVDTSQTAGYQEVSTSQTPNYSEIDTSQTPNYEELAA